MVLSDLLIGAHIPVRETSPWNKANVMAMRNKRTQCRTLYEQIANKIIARAIRSLSLSAHLFIY